MRALGYVAVMNLVPKLPSRIVSALLAVALAFSPVAAFAGHQDAAGTVHSAASDEMPPCDMPCGDCAEGDVSAACAIACSGLIAAIPSQPAPLRHSAVMRVRAASAVVVAGRDREPDKPPPRLILA